MNTDNRLVALALAWLAFWFVVIAVMVVPARMPEPGCRCWSRSTADGATVEWHGSQECYWSDPPKHQVRIPQ